MRKRVAAVAMTAAMVLAIPGVAMAGNGYGKGVQECLGANYGQAKNLAWETGHATKPAAGAKVTYMLHCSP